jgi:hypothetical protein
VITEAVCRPGGGAADRLRDHRVLRSASVLNDFTVLPACAAGAAMHGHRLDCRTCPRTSFFLRVGIICSFCGLVLSVERYMGLLFT